MFLSETSSEVPESKGCGRCSSPRNTLPDRKQKESEQMSICTPLSELYLEYRGLVPWPCYRSMLSPEQRLFYFISVTITLVFR